MRAILARVSAVLARPANSSMGFGGAPQPQREPAITRPWRVSRLGVYRRRSRIDAVTAWLASDESSLGWRPLLATDGVELSLEG
jgi:hypothetical protein